MGKKKHSVETVRQARVEVRREDGRRWVPAPFVLPEVIPAGVVVGVWLADDERVEWVMEQRPGGAVATGYKIFVD